MSLLFCFLNSEVLDILRKKLLRLYRAKFASAAAAAEQDHHADGVIKRGSFEFIMAHFGTDNLRVGNCLWSIGRRRCSWW